MHLMQIGVPETDDPIQRELKIQHWRIARMSKETAKYTVNFTAQEYCMSIKPEKEPEFRSKTFRD